tara:strand:+ start:109 stop:414 length:306 start_codon:yes stop_codon:yes gene_type:complete
MKKRNEWPWIGIKAKCVEMTVEEWGTLDYECPFCGSSMMEFTLTFAYPGESSNDALYAVHCVGCCSDGPMACDRETAIDRYNGNWTGNELQGNLTHEKTNR